MTPAIFADRCQPPWLAAARGEKLAELHEQIVAGTEVLVSSQGWQEMLQLVARMPQYSLNNVLGHFAKRKVELGTCGRAYGTPCQHEHAPPLSDAASGPCTATPARRDHHQPRRPASPRPRNVDGPGRSMGWKPALTSIHR